MPPGGHPGGCEDRADPREFRQCRFRSDPFGVVADDDKDFRRGVRSDAERLDELWSGPENELFDHRLQFSERLVAALMSQARIAGLPGPAKVKRLHGVATADDLVHRKFHRLSPNELWVTDITEHPTREGKVFCCAVMDTFSRKIVGWSIDNAQDSNLVLNARDMAIKNRQPAAGGIVHADHGVQFTSWAFTSKIRASGLMPSFGTIGDCYDNSMMESIWSSMQIELLNRKKWRTRVDWRVALSGSAVLAMRYVLSQYRVYNPSHDLVDAMSQHLVCRVSHDLDYRFGGCGFLAQPSVLIIGSA
nr:IS3 family transposase [Glaciihabitans sp. INWT7]